MEIKSAKSKHLSAQKEGHAFLPIRKVAVLGAGVMGAQIAAHCANVGCDVVLLDIAADGKDKNAIVNGAMKKIGKMKPAPFMNKLASSRIRTGNFDDHLDLLSDREWIVEVVIERLDIKQGLMEKIEAVAPKDAVITTNTSGLPIHKIAEGRSQSFKKRFFGTHFFNPPRYLKLFEVIPTPDTDTEHVARISDFARRFLGKGIVMAKDTPNFIANRIGTYALQVHLSALNEGFTIEEIDVLTGTLTGRPKSATFRTADVVGLDTLVHVAKNLYEAIPHDESRDAFKVPPLLQKLVDNKHLGAKTKAGFYKKEGSEIKSINPETLKYESAKPLNIGDLKPLKGIESVTERWKALWNHDSRGGSFIKTYTAQILWYAAQRMPEISEHPADVDNAIKWGFGWQLGPFEIWDAVGFDAVLSEWKAQGLETPAWIAALQKPGAKSFYTKKGVHSPSGELLSQPSFSDEFTVGQLTAGKTPVWENEESALWDVDGVTLFEFRSKANTLGSKVVQGLMKAVDITEKGDYAGMVVANDGANFSVGANLGEMAQEALAGNFKAIGEAVYTFQMMVQKVRYARKPIVAAPIGKTLGGGCELAMACAHVIPAAETYIGLVELGVGLMPAGTGTMHFAHRAVEEAQSEFPSQVQPFLLSRFETVAMAKVATSAQEAMELGYFDPARTTVAMNSDRRISMAINQVKLLFENGYMPEPQRNRIMVMGKTGRAPMLAAAVQMKWAGFISEYDEFLAERFAYILTGGEITGPDYVSEDYLLKLERDVFLALLQQEKTQARIKSILTTNKPLRN